MKKPMLNAIQKARMSMAMKSKNPKMNPGFESLPKEVQMKIMKSKKPKMAMMKKPMKVTKKSRLKEAKRKLDTGTGFIVGDFSNDSKKQLKKTIKAEDKFTQAQESLRKDKVGKAMRKFKSGIRKAVKGGVITKEERKEMLKDAKSNLPANKPKMAMKKKPKLRGGKFKSMPIKPGETKTEYRNRLAGPKGPQRYKKKAAKKKKPKMAMKKPAMMGDKKPMLSKSKKFNRKASDIKKRQEERLKKEMAAKKKKAKAVKKIFKKVVPS